MAACILLGLAIANIAYAQTTVTVGAGSGDAYQFPLNYGYAYNYTQTIYTAAEINAAGGAPGIISRVKFLPRYSNSTAGWNNWTVYLGQTNKAGFLSKTDWIPLSSLTEVFTGSLPANTIADNWMQIQLNTPFNWDGLSNIVVAVYENTPSACYEINTWGGYTQVPSEGSKGIYYRNDYNLPNPASPPLANLTTNTVAQIQFEFAAYCTGVSTPSLTSSVDQICHGMPFQLTAAPEGLLGLSYQYQQSTDEGITWHNLGFSTTDNFYTVLEQTTTTQYRVIVSCASGVTAISPDITVNQNAPIECYCTPTTGSGTYYYINSFLTTGGLTNINKISGNATAGHSDFHLSDSLSCYQGTVVGFNISVPVGLLNVGHAIWIDFNENGIFEATEKVAYNNFYTPLPITGSFAVPETITPGSKRMRVAILYGVIEPTNPCSTSSHGEFEDYTLVVLGTPECAGTPNPGATYASSNFICAGSPVTLGFTNHPNISGLSYAWYASTNGGTTWSVIPGATDSVYTTTPSVATSYQVVVTCNATGESATASAVTVDFHGQIASVAANAVCAGGSATLSATPLSASGISWYPTPVDPTIVATGEVFITPELTSTTTYYAAPISIIPVSAAVGAGDFESNSGSPFYTGQSPFAHAFGNYKHQMLITAAELSAAGIVAGPINSVSFVITSPAMGTSYALFQNFTISLKESSASFMTNAFESGLTQVWSDDFKPVTGVNTFNFSTPFVWDGMSNLIVQTCYNNNNGGSVDQSAEVQFDYTLYPAHTIYRKDGVTPGICDVAYGNSMGDGPVITSRPKMIFNASGTCAGLRVPVVAAVDEPVTLDLGSTVTICAGETLTLDAGTGASAYAWNTGAASQAIEVSEPGIYEVTVQEGACSSSAALEVLEMPAAQTGAIVAINNAPEFSFSAPEAMGGVSYSWAFGDGATATGASATHTYAANGAYEVTFTAENACGEVTTTATKVTVSGLGIAQTQHAGHLVQLYPNPTSGRTTISANGAVIAKVEVMDNLGRVVLRSEPAAEQGVIEAGNLAKGIYTLRIHTSKGISTAKLVVNDK